MFPRVMERPAFPIKDASLDKRNLFLLTRRAVSRCRHKKLIADTVAYPGLGLGIRFSAKQNSTGSWESESLGYGVKSALKKFNDYIQKI